MTRQGDGRVNTIVDQRGLKRICINCGARFYDMNKRPISCPVCQTEFTGDMKAKGRRGKPAANDEVTPENKIITPDTADGAENGAEDSADESDREDDRVVSIEDIDEDGKNGDETDDEDDLDLDGDLEIDDLDGDLDDDLDDDDLDVDVDVDIEKDD